MKSRRDDSSAFFVLCFIRLFCSGRVKCEQIKATDADEGIDDPGQPGHAAKKSSDKVKIEKTNQSPIDSTDDGNCESNAV